MERVAGGHGGAVRAEPGDAVRLVNTHGTQVVDAWALSADDPSEYLSVEHTRRMSGHLHPEVGDSLWSNRRNPMLVLEEDSFPGTHDTIVACCDSWLYAHYECPPGHRNCRDNFLEALAALDVEPPVVPNPVNFWMNVPVDGNSVSVTEPMSRPGDHVLLRAKMPVYVIFSACPMDIVPINGPDLAPKDVHFEVIGAA